MARGTNLTGTAGEHFVAYRLARMGFIVALTRGGSSNVDLMVGDPSGSRAVAVQVKTSSYAWRSYTRKPENNHWEWDVGPKALERRADGLLYTFVDLKDEGHTYSTPDVFVVPSPVVADQMVPESARHMFWIMEQEAAHYRENWSLITVKLGDGQGIS